MRLDRAGRVTAPGQEVGLVQDRDGIRRGQALGVSWPLGRIPWDEAYAVRISCTDIQRGDYCVSRKSSVRGASSEGRGA